MGSPKRSFCAEQSLFAYFLCIQPRGLISAAERSCGNRRTCPLLMLGGQWDREQGADMTQSQTGQFDAVIVGGGPVGMTLALALGQSLRGMRLALIDRRPLSVPRDNRASAIA